MKMELSAGTNESCKLIAQAITNIKRYLNCDDVIFDPKDDISLFEKQLLDNKLLKDATILLDMALEKMTTVSST
jgi:hypothetical protein